MPAAPKPSQLGPESSSAPAHIPEVMRATLDVPPTTAESAAPAPGSDAPGIPPSAQPSYPRNFMNIKLPDLSAPDIQPETPIVRPPLLPSRSAFLTEPTV